MNTSRTALLDLILSATSKPTLGPPSKYAPDSAANLRLPCERETSIPRALIRTKANKAVNDHRKRQQAAWKALNQRSSSTEEDKDNNDMSHDHSE
jgi:hypothetical protein